MNKPNKLPEKTVSVFKRITTSPTGKLVVRDFRHPRRLQNRSKYPRSKSTPNNIA